MGCGDSPRCDSWLDDVQPLEQALKQHAIQPDLVYSSALGRARQTAEYFATCFDLDGVKSSAELNEINYGALYGMQKKCVAEQYPKHKKDPDFIYPQGESFNQMQRRTVAHIQSLAEMYAGRTVLCVAHAGVIRALVCHFLDLDFAPRLKCNVSHRYVGVMDFLGADCVAYDEWGNPSGFVREGAVMLPFRCKSA